MLKKPVITANEIDREELIKLLKKIRPDLDLSKKSDFIRAFDSFAFSVIIGSSYSVAEAIGRVENIKYNMQKFVYSKDFDKYLSMMEEKAIKDDIKKSETQAG
jgi:hypothetical protein